jgi:hypothetical protein
MHLFHPMVEIEKQNVKINGPSWTICFPSPWKHQPCVQTKLLAPE